MLIRFSCENFSSFRDEIEFSMLAGRSRQHPEHIVSDHKRDGLKILKSAIVYGANASGKSNLVKAMRFAKESIVKGSKPKRQIPYNPFRLDSTCVGKPSKFEFEIRIGESNFNYGFKMDASRVHEEWLYQIGRTSEVMLFERRTNNDETTEVEFGKVEFSNADDKQFAHFTAKGTRPNQLFLTESIERGAKYFENIYHWFDEVLTFVFPDSHYMGLEKALMTDESFKESLVRYLKLLEVGISGIRLNEHSFANEPSNSPESRSQIIDNLNDSKSPRSQVLVETPGGARYLLFKAKGEGVKSYKIMTTHAVKGASQDVEFDIADESDGTKRLLDLIPALMLLLSDDRVFIVDELDRSLHPELSRRIVELFLGNKAEQASQLIVTTHESSLLDLDLIRRDEIWFVEKNNEGASTAYSLEEFAPRDDKDIRKGYLLGRYGAIPMIRNVSNLSWIR